MKTAITTEESEDPDTIAAGARTREFWLEKRAAKKRRSVAWFQRMHRHKKPRIEDTVADQMESVFESEFAYYKWNVGTIICCYCFDPVSKRNLTREHVVPRSKGGSDKQANVMPCCADCNHEKGDMSLLEYLAFKALGPASEALEEAS